MNATHAAGCDSSNAELVNELAALASLLHQGAPEAQAAYRPGVRWHPAGVVLEQLVADLTIVYSLPKVGSSTITATLNRHPAVRPEATHLHFLSTNGLAALECEIARHSHSNVRFLQEHLAQARGVRVLLAANRALRSTGTAPTVRKPYVLVGVREPIAMHLSLAFEIWWLNTDRPESLSAESVRTGLCSGSVVRDADNWFTNELEEVFGVNVFARPFPTDRGWDIYENDAARVLVVRQDDLDRLPDALGALYGLEPTTFAVETCNVATDKSYARHYATVKRTLRLTESELDRVYAARFVRHFYTEAEIARFRRRWSGERSGTADHAPPAAPKPAPAVRPEPTCGSRDHNCGEPHIWVCRPCLRCELLLNALPGLRDACAEQSAHIDHLEAAWRAAQQPAPRPRGPLRSLARCLPGPLRSLAKRILRGGRAV